METFIITFLMLVVNIFMLKCKPSTPESDNRKLLIKQCNTVFILGVCGWPRKLDNLTWCKMPVKLTRKGRAFYEKVV